jgi:putative endonuclease
MKEIGKLGEKLVAQWLKIQNYEILQHNWRCRWGEIDLVILEPQDKAIAFVEVKTRSQNNWDANGLFSVDSSKQQKIIQTASLFLAKYPQLAELPCRFDVALVSYQILNESVSQNIAKIQQVTQLSLGQSYVIGQYQLAIENYLTSAFDLSD